MPVFALILVITLLAFLVESLTEYFFGKLVENIPALKPFGWLLMYIAMAIGIAGAWVYQFDLLYLLGNFLEEMLTIQGGAPVVLNVPLTWFGITLTGMGIGRGANFIHDAVSKYFVKPQVTG